eukprot:jgi/Tetstr1/431867/TSEL_021357.t1
MSRNGLLTRFRFPRRGQQCPRGSSVLRITVDDPGAEIHEEFEDGASALPSVKDQLKLVVFWGEATSEAQEAVKALGIELASFDELLEAGTSNPVPQVECDPKDLCTIMYTSGTTGDPKGVTIKHSNLMAEIKAASAFTSATPSARASAPTTCSCPPCRWPTSLTGSPPFLPAHAALGDIKYLLEDIAELRPTLFCWRAARV